MRREDAGTWIDGNSAMVTRRQVVGAAAATAASGIAFGCSADGAGYDDLVAETWRIDALPPDVAERQRELVRYATLAANGHNTQPWRFRLEPDRITILPDHSRRTPVVDPDDHHLYASLGCATENIVQAAPAMGLKATPRFDAEADAIVVDMETAPVEVSALFQAVPERQSTRATFDGSAADSETLTVLQSAGSEAAVDLLLVTDRQKIEDVLEFTVAGNTAQLNDPAFVRELKDWVRFTESEAAETRDGLFAGASGNPTLPRWLASPLFSMFLSADSENAKYAEHIRSSAGVAVFVGPSDDPAGWVAAGQACQRFALQATALDLRTAFINQPVEVPELRPQFAASLGIGDRRPDLVVRFGRGPVMPRSLRRAVNDVIV